MLVPVPDDVSPPAVACVSDNVADTYAGVAPGLERCPAAPVVVVSASERPDRPSELAGRTTCTAHHRPDPASARPGSCTRHGRRIRPMRAAAHFGLEGLPPPGAPNERCRSGPPSPDPGRLDPCRRRCSRPRRCRSTRRGSSRRWRRCTRSRRVTPPGYVTSRGSFRQPMRSMSRRRRQGCQARRLDALRDFGGEDEGNAEAQLHGLNGMRPMRRNGFAAPWGCRACWSWPRWRWSSWRGLRGSRRPSSRCPRRRVRRSRRRTFRSGRVLSPTGRR
jgi:hypothetical protein